jgi:hypothetical protein
VFQIVSIEKPGMHMYGTGVTYTTDGSRATPTLGDHVPGAAAFALIALVYAHIIPIHLVVFGFERRLLFVAVQGSRD